VKFLAANEVNVGDSVHFKYAIYGGRKSGDYHTSLGNTMLAAALRH